MKFKGDIIITDPCYIIKEKSEEDKKHELPHPKMEDFYIYGTDVKNYPDAKYYNVSDMLELIETDNTDNATDTLTELLAYQVRFHGHSTDPLMGYTSKIYMDCNKRYKQALRDHFKSQEDDWDKCGYGKNMQVLGITNYLCNSTLYGDWSCTAYNSDTKEELGRFCADAGLVAVFLLDEVLTYNPDFDYHIKRPWTTTLIKDFEGEVEIKTLHSEEYDEDYVSVVGTGNVNFETYQTGL